MKDHPTTEELFEAYIKKLHGSKAQKIHQHLENCDECRQVIFDYQKIENQYSQQKFEQPSESVVQNIQAKAKKIYETKPKNFFVFYRIQRLAGVVMGLLIVAGIGIFYKWHDNEFSTFKNNPVSSVSSEEGHELKDKTPSMDGMITPVPPSPKEEYAPSSGGVAGLSESVGPSYNLKNVSFLEEGEGTPRQSLKKGALTEVPKTFDQLDMLFVKALAVQRQGFLYQSPKKILQSEEMFRAIWMQNQNFSRSDQLLYYWALSLEQLGRKEEALEKLTLLEKIKPTYPGIKETRSRME